jgi:HK97 family phage major capsid protein
MTDALKQYLIEKFGLAEDADEAAAKAMASDKLKSEELSMDKFTELLHAEAPAKSKGDELVEKLAAANEKMLTKVLEKMTPQPAPEPDPVEPEPEGEAFDAQKELEELRTEFAKKFEAQKVGGDGDALMRMAHDALDDDGIVVKSVSDRFNDTKTAVKWGDSGEDRKVRHAELTGRKGHPIKINNGTREINHSTELTKHLTAAWLKLQLYPESFNWDDPEDGQVKLIHYALHKCKFTLPGEEDARLLRPDERLACLNYNKNYYRHGCHTSLLLPSEYKSRGSVKGMKAVIDDSTSGGENAIPEFFDMDLIVTPTLASEDIVSFCNLVMVPRGVAAQNFTMGRPTIAAANTEGSAVSLFSTASFIAAHDTSFFRAAGFIELGRNWLLDANPRCLGEIQNQYMNSVKLWLNEQLMNGDGTTEPQGVLNDTGIGDITPATPTTGDPTVGDVLELLFGVNKEFRTVPDGTKAIFVMTDTRYHSIRAIATGVTGDTRLVFGHNVEDYMLFNHPVLIEETGLGNANGVFAQMRGYRLYQRQGARFIREDRGDTLVRENTEIVGVDVRYGGQLDLPGYAAVIDSWPTTFAV